MQLRQCLKGHLQKSQINHLSSPPQETRKRAQNGMSTFSGDNGSVLCIKRDEGLQPGYPLSHCTVNIWVYFNIVQLPSISKKSYIKIIIS